MVANLKWIKVEPGNYESEDGLWRLWRNEHQPPHTQAWCIFRGVALNADGTVDWEHEHCCPSFNEGKSIVNAILDARQPTHERSGVFAHLDVPDLTPKVDPWKHCSWLTLVGLMREHGLSMRSSPRPTEKVLIAALEAAGVKPPRKLTKKQKWEKAKTDAAQRRAR